MKVNVNVDCTPQEARAFFGLPDVAPINELMVAEVEKRLASNMEAMDPMEMMRSWMALGGSMQNSFFELMSKAASGTTSED